MHKIGNEDSTSETRHETYTTLKQYTATQQQDDKKKKYDKKKITWPPVCPP